ncbi:MAG: 50S ribosomal protein L35 [Candidatus Omnitrophota bacterium]
MPKLKTRKGVAKRFKLTKKGKIKFFPGGKSHLNSSKLTKKKRHLRKMQGLKGGKEIKYIKRLLPYG